MDPTIFERLNSTRTENDDADFEKFRGLWAGYAWTAHTATYAQLRRLVVIGRNVDYGFNPDTSPSVSLFLMAFGDIADTFIDGKTINAAEFWEAVAHTGSPTPSTAFLDGFIEAAAESLTSVNQLRIVEEVSA